MQESAVELLFAAFFTTASASTSLVLLLLQHPGAIAKIRQELEAQGLGRACSCGPGAAGDGAGRWPDCGCAPDLSLAALGGLPYVDCVVKEVLRLLPPVSGGYRTALRTFELDVSAPAPRRCFGAGAGGGGGERRRLALPCPSQTFHFRPAKWAGLGSTPPDPRWRGASLAPGEATG